VIHTFFITLFSWSLTRAFGARRFTQTRLFHYSNKFAIFAPITVPTGAQAGDLTMEPCTHEARDVEYAADCGTLVVSENRSEPTSRLIALPVTRIRATGSNPAEPIFRLGGGIGAAAFI